jgi:hypothetical protein
VGGQQTAGIITLPSLSYQRFVNFEFLASPPPEAIDPGRAHRVIACGGAQSLMPICSNSHGGLLSGRDKLPAAVRVFTDDETDLGPYLVEIKRCQIGLVRLEVATRARREDRLDSDRVPRGRAARRIPP